ncbi:unnamed protein product [Cochlearia groenlandica]
MDAPNPKRPCHDPSVTSSIENPNSLHIASGFNQSNVDLTISSFLSLSDLPLFSSPLSIGCSFDRVLDKVSLSGTETSGDEFDQDGFLDRTLQLALLLCKSTKRCIRKRSTIQNSISWPLLPELTTKVFSMLDTKSLMQAAACCTMFKKCAMDRVCYSHIDLTKAAKHVDNGVVCIMIHRAGKELRSLKLGSTSWSGELPLLTRSCLSPLSFDNGFAGGLLRSLQLYNLTSINSQSLCSVLSHCSNLTDLKIVGFVSGYELHRLEQLKGITRNCRMLEHLYIENFVSAGLIGDSTLVEFLDNCPNLTSLTLVKFGVNDAIARSIITGFHQLKYLNLSKSPGISGCFLRDLEDSFKDSPLETIILRDCTSLEEEEVLQFLDSLLAGKFRFIKHIDISNDTGLVGKYGKRSITPNFPLDKLKEYRPNVKFVANFKDSLSSNNGQVQSGGEDSSSDDSSSSEEDE